MSKKNKKNTPPSVSTPLKQVEQSFSSSSKSFWDNTSLQAWIIFAISFLLYANTLTHDFCQDDAIVITENTFTKQGLSGIGDILSYDTFYGFFNEPGKTGLVAGGRYRPFTLIMFAIEYQIFGKNAFMGHLFNVLWFAFTCWLLYHLLLKLLKYRPDTEGYAPLMAFGAALLFAAHPIHTEVVANIKGRDEIITLLGSIAAVWFSIKYFEKGGIFNQIIAGILFFIGLMSKENAITFVLIVPLIYWFFMKTDWTIAFKQAIPFLVSAVAFIGVRSVVIGNSLAEQTELLNNPYLKLVDNQYVPFSFGEKMATIVYTLGKYIQLLIFPHPLTHDYYPRHIGIMTFGDWQVLLSLILYGGLIALILRRWQRREIWSFGIAFFLITLSIVSNIVFAVGTNMAERFMFMPSVGFCLVVAYFLVTILRGRTTMAFIAIAALFGIKTFMRNFDWKDNYTIFTRDVSISTNSAKLQTSAGGEIITKAGQDTIMDRTKRAALIQEGIGHLKRSLEIHPFQKNPYLLMGNAYYYLLDYDNAIVAYENALKYDANFKEVLTNLGMTYRDAGKFYGQQKGDLPKAVDYLEKSLKYVANDAGTCSLLGTAYGMTGQYQKAADVLHKALAIRFDRQDAMNLSATYNNLRDPAKAQEWANRAQIGK